MDERQLRDLLARHEDDQVEFTTSTRDTDKFCEAVCAFANDLPNHGSPGYLIIGVSDAGELGGLKVTDERQQAIAPEVIAENNRSVQEQLASLRFFDLGRGCATHAGILLFGLDVRNWLPGAYIQFLRVQGDSLAAPVLNDRELDGDLLTVLRELDALVDAQLEQFPVEESTLRERSAESYPREAVRELLMNAVMSRDYASTSPLRITWLEDRLEIQSPGGLYGEASEANFPRQTSY